jgi:prevent-host-death family protein
MSIVVSVDEAQRQWPGLLDLVAHGERITITKNGQPVAMLVPPERERRDVRAAIAELRALRAGKSLGGISVRELIEQGRHA